MRQTLHLLHDSYKLYGTLHLKKMYNDYKYKYEQAIKQAKITANNAFIKNHCNNSKAMWSLINRNKKRTVQDTTKILPNDFNAYFTNIATDIVSSFLVYFKLEMYRLVSAD